ncbi:PEP-CTERM sorting domain-containing protein [Coraliomargarita sp. W4R53]
MQKCLSNVQSGGSLRGLVSSALPSIPSLASLPAILLCAAAVSLPSASNAAINMVLNGDFSEAGNDDTASAALLLLGSYDEEFGTGPWSVRATGIDLGFYVVPDIAPPSADIGSGISGDATIGGIVSSGAAFGLLSTSATIYQNDTLYDFVEGQEYTLTAEVTTGSLLDVDLLTDWGIGIGLLADGVSTSSAAYGGSDPIVTLSLGVLSGSTATITYTFVAGVAEAGKNIGVELYAKGGAGVADITALGGVSFDNVTLVPEPSASALLVGLLGVAYVGFRRSKRAR